MSYRFSQIDELVINTIRILSIEAIQRANSGHPGLPLGDSPLAYLIWSKFLKFNPDNPLWPNRDRFILSAGHGSSMLYSLLHLFGYNISLEDLKNFRQLGSKTPGHPEYDPQLGIEMTTGPLGQGFATGVGLAMAEKYLGQLFNRPQFSLIDHQVYGLVSDGDIMEGISSESASLAGHLGLGKLVYIYLDNKICIEGPTQLTISENVASKFQAMGWHVQKVDGYNLQEVANAIQDAKFDLKHPSLIVARTIIGRGSPNQENLASCHGSPLGEKEVELTKKNLGWNYQDNFYVPTEVTNHIGKLVAEKKLKEHQWSAKFEEYGQCYPHLAKKWLKMEKGEMAEGWQKNLPSYEAGSSVATRKVTGKILNQLAKNNWQIIGGSADLAPSNNTYINEMGDFGSVHGGRNIHFGIREHAMGAILNGLGLNKMLVPYGGTFLVFSDYMKPAIRLAALMKLGVIYVFTHDSIGLGEDGPTHQPIEQLVSLRSIPNLTVIRPADAQEAVVAWKWALENRQAPCALIFSRQSLTVLDRDIYPDPLNLQKGAYTLFDHALDKSPAGIIIASGAEVHPALAASCLLKQKGILVQVVNMPSWELFQQQSLEYQNQVLPPEIEIRLAVEAGSPIGWEKFTGLKGKVLGIDGFGASAPADKLFKEYGFTAENIADNFRALL